MVASFDYDYQKAFRFPFPTQIFDQNMEEITKAMISMKNRKMKGSDYYSQMMS